MLLHAQKRGPGAINEHLWPYAVRNAADVDNNLPRLKTKQSPLERFSSVAIRPKAKYFHPFGCPSYVLNSKMQDNRKDPSGLRELESASTWATVQGMQGRLA